MTTQTSAHRRLQGLAVLALLALVPFASGCSYTFRVTAMPTLDTQGRVGAQATVGFGGGLTDPQKNPDEHDRVGFIGPGLELGGGVIGGGAPNYTLAGSLDYVEVAHKRGTLGFRSSVYGGVYGTSLQRADFTAGLRLAMQLNVAQPARDQFVMFGVIGQVGVRDPDPLPAFGEAGLGLALDWNFVESWSMPSCRNGCSIRTASGDSVGSVRSSQAR